MASVQRVPETTASTRQDWQVGLKRILAQASLDRKVALVGVGHPLRGDDYVGSHVAREAAERMKRLPCNGVYIVDAEANVDAFIGELLELQPVDIVFIDACDMDTRPGETRLLSVAETSYAFFTTHGIPLKVLAEQLLDGTNVWVLAVQPSSVEFGKEMSHEVHEAASKIVDFLSSNIQIGDGAGA